jgi:hypothetical protein
VSIPIEFQKYADACRQLAADGDVAAHRNTLYRMAQDWDRLAAEEERIADLVREVDTLFTAPRTAMDELLRRAGLASH